VSAEPPDGLPFIMGKPCEYRSPKIMYVCVAL
jgi:hypothetical protein